MDEAIKPISPFNGKPACGARCRDGHLCLKPAMANGRCKTHGGGAPTGVACSWYKHGRYSRQLPERMQSRYDDARADRDYLNLTDDIALIDARLSDLLERVDSGESGELWRALQMAVHAFREADRRNIVGRNRETELESIWTLIQAGTSDYAAWRDVRSLLKDRRETVDREQKRLVAMQELATSDQIALLFGQLSRIIQVYVPDTATKSNISRELHTLASQFLNVEPAEVATVSTNSRVLLR